MRVTCARCGREADAFSITRDPVSRATVVSVRCHGERERATISDAQLARLTRAEIASIEHATLTAFGEPDVAQVPALR